MSAAAAMIDGAVLGTALAEEFGLNSRYFSKLDDADTLNPDIKIVKFKHVVLVELPFEARHYIRDYTATPIQHGDDESQYEYVLKITNKMKIGFWK